MTAKDLGVHPYLYPMPTYMIGTYNEDDSVDVMMMAWGGICASDMVALNLEAEHKTCANLRARKAFTLAIPGTDTLEQSDYLGIASGSKVPDKFARTGLHARKSQRVDAPIIEEYPSRLSVNSLKCRISPTVHASWVRSSTSLQTSACLTKKAKLMWRELAHLPLIRCVTITTLWAKKRAKPGCPARSIWTN